LLNEKENELLKHLRVNSRKSLAKVSKETGIPLSTLFETLKKLESEWITKHTSLLDFSKMGHNVKVHMVMNTNRKPELKEHLVQSPNVNSLSSLINEHDFYAECIFKDLKEMSEFKEQLTEFDINHLEHTFIIDDIKREGFHP